MLRGFRPGRRFRAARIWSNRMLRRMAPMFQGDVINVSGWNDEDKEGGRYREYFTGARSYAITNYGGYRGQADDGADIRLDLEADLDPTLLACADVIYNHTTLEHVFDVFKAVSNLCAMTRDVVIVVVPAFQEEHPTEGFGDYWRFMSGGLRRLFEANGLTPVLLASSPYRDTAVYHLCVASRRPEYWKSRLQGIDSRINDGRDLFRESLVERLVYRFRTSGEGH